MLQRGWTDIDGEGLFVAVQKKHISALHRFADTIAHQLKGNLVLHPTGYSNISQNKIVPEF